MSIPLDRLYNFLHDVCNRDDLIIYRFFPHGSRKITDLLPTGVVTKFKTNLRDAICYDQEPLNFDLYSTTEVAMEHFEFSKTATIKPKSELGKEKVIEFYRKLNLRMVTVPYPHDHKPILLIHSEKNSSQVTKYEETLGMAGVYWWCHAAIARDWFRYAEHDTLLLKRTPKNDFLIYNRAWSGTREYRLKFVELLVNHQLTNNCHIKFSPYDDGRYYCDHDFLNKNLSITTTNLEELFELNTTDASASADYVSSDYCSTHIEVVLETLFDDERIQLTEKILRPIACGHPFILASTPGSLEYLRSYGFKTFNQYIDESYDAIPDSLGRLNAIVKEMKRISILPINEKQELYANLRSIAEHNKELFFSNPWHDQIIQEFKNNIELALEKTTSFKTDASDLKSLFHLNQF